MRHELDVVAVSPTQAAPECPSCVVLRQDHEMTLIEASLPEGVDAALRECSTDAASAMGRGHGQVLEIAAPTVGSAEDGADDAIVLGRDEAQAGVEAQVAGNGPGLVDVAKDEALGSTPERQNFVVVSRPELT
jgi:hypothetical protein